MNQIENPILSARITDDPVAKPIGKCHYRYCDELIYKNDGIEFDGYIYCCTSCLGEELIEEGAAIDLSQV